MYSRLIFTFTIDLLFPIWLFPWSGNSCLFLPSFVPLKSLTTEAYSCARASTVARLRSQNGLDLKWLLLCQESDECLVLFLPEPPTLSAYTTADPLEAGSSGEGQTWGVREKPPMPLQEEWPPKESKDKDLGPC